MLFLLTPLREGRQNGSRVVADYELISTHAPAGGATACEVIDITILQNFYSRPCGRGDTQAVKIVPVTSISTHAPAGGATRSIEDRPEHINISTHAPAGGATSTIC